MGKGRGHIPLRTCVSCGVKKSKRQMVRLVLDPQGQLTWDRSKLLKGRGMYVCGERVCWEVLAKEKSIKNAFGKRGPVLLHRSLLEEIRGGD
jgi:predicted RNA-binding protein YlxR (DUF448 family)